MDETRVFKTYNDRLNPIDMDFLYDYAAAGYYEDIPAPMPRRSYAPPRELPRSRSRERRWEKERTVELDEIEERPISRAGQGVSLLTLFGFAVAAVMLVLVLFSHIELTALSESAAECQSRITELTEQQHKLQAAYETSFCMDEVEAYAIHELGMQKVRPDQIVYLNDLGDTDRAQIVHQKEQSMFSLAFEGVLERLWAYFG